jgi:hypothetical protein
MFDGIDGEVFGDAGLAAGIEIDRSALGTPPHTRILARIETSGR